MKQIIEIEVPDGKKAVWKDNTIVFEDIKPQLPKTWGEFCNMKPLNEYETYINGNNQWVEIGIPDGMKRRPYEDRNILPSIQASEQHRALMQLHQLRDCYRQGWTPNWGNNSSKYVIKNGRFKIIRSTHICDFLAFPTFQLAEEFLNNFKDLIEQAGDLI